MTRPLLVALILIAPARVGAAPPPTRCLDGRAVLAPAGPWALALETGAGVGIFSAHHGRVGLSLGRRFLDRLDVQASFHYGRGQVVDLLEESLRLGLLLHLGRRLDLLVGWRLGYAHFRIRMPTGVLWTGGLLASVVGELKLSLWPALELRLTPLAGTGYWNDFWQFTLEPALGLAYRF